MSENNENAVKKTIIGLSEHEMFRRAIHEGFVATGQTIHAVCKQILQNDITISCVYDILNRSNRKRKVKPEVAHILCLLTATTAHEYMHLMVLSGNSLDPYKINKDILRYYLIASDIYASNLSGEWISRIELFYKEYDNNHQIEAAINSILSSM